MPVLLAALVVGALWTLRATPPASSSRPSRPASSPPVVKTLRVDVLRQFPHDTDAFTQGLVWWNDQLFESTGLRGESDLRRVDPETGEVEQIIEVADRYFAEGLALVDDRLIMLTLDAGEAFTYHRDTFEQGVTFTYEGEGWGLCHDGRRLVMSNGSDRLSFRDPETFEETGGVQVRLRGQPLSNLNELECVGDVVYANVWQQDVIVRIDPRSGRVTDYIDATGLLPDRRGTDVLNGIAWNGETETFYITGKWWPTMFEVRFVP